MPVKNVQFPKAKVTSLSEYQYKESKNVKSLFTPCYVQLLLIFSLKCTSPDKLAAKTIMIAIIIVHRIMTSITRLFFWNSTDPSANEESSVGSGVPLKNLMKLGGREGVRGCYRRFFTRNIAYTCSLSRHNFWSQVCLSGQTVLDRV